MAASLKWIVLFPVVLYTSSGTRFLPSVLWDNANPLLCCPYNWLVIPRVDLHDILDFVCPTSKLVNYEVTLNNRLRETMNFNLFRREWTDSVEDLQESIRNGSIHSFCNVSKPDSVKLSTCRDGKYGSFQVKFTHFIFDEDRIKYEKYEKDRTYVFFSNEDGSVTSLNSKQARCNMMFAVHTASQEKRQFDITYDKEVVPSKCKCNPMLKPTLAPTTSSQETTTSVSTTSSTTSPPPSARQESTSTLPPSTTATSDASTTVTSTLHETSTTKKAMQPSNDIQTQCDDSWLSIPIFIAVIIASLILGILCTVLFFNFIWRRPAFRKGGYNNGLYSCKLQTATRESTLSSSGRNDV